MGIEHSVKDEPVDSMRCPMCGHVSTVSVNDGKLQGSEGSQDHYYYCQNPKCAVERIYGDNAVMLGGAYVGTGS